jgi:hypothetical protein
MADSPEVRNLHLAQEATEKYDAYFLALTFTLLAASVETAKWSSCRISSGAEIIAWFLFAASGLLGLKRAAWTPGFFKTAADHSRADDRARALAVHPVSREEAEKSFAEAKRLQATLDAKNRLFQKIYTLQWWTFVMGLLLILARRAFEGIILGGPPASH